MLRVVILSWALPCLLLVSGPARAVFVDGNLLWEQCAVSREDAHDMQSTTQVLACAQYILGVTDAQGELFDGNERSATRPQALANMPVLFCRSDDTSSGQVIDAVRAYLSDHPEVRPWGAPSIIISPLKEKFPCN
jgi:Ssp1 endopeptidase immunity protein Rap1a